MTPEQRTDQAKRAAEARWGKRHVLKATHGSPDHPLRIGDVEIDCYVLEDDTRVVTQRSMIKAMNLTRGGARNDGETGGAELPRFATQNWISGHISNGLAAALSSPIVFRAAGIGVAYGYPATILADICDAILAAREGCSIFGGHVPILLLTGDMSPSIVCLVNRREPMRCQRTKHAGNADLPAASPARLLPPPSLKSRIDP